MIIIYQDSEISNLKKQEKSQEIIFCKGLCKKNSNALHKITKNNGKTNNYYYTLPKLTIRRKNIILYLFANFFL